MAVRKDEVQISISFLTDESREYAGLVKENQKFIKDLKTAQKEGKDLSGVVDQIAKSSRAAAKIDLSKLTPSQLVQRARQLQQAIKLIPQSAPAYNALETELKQVNDQLATMRSKTRGVSDQMKKSEGKLSAGMKRLGGTIIATFALDKLIDWGKQLFKIGVQSDALARKSLTVLGNQLEDVQEAAEKNAQAMGLTTQEYVNATTAVADLLVPMGFQRKEAADISTGLVDLSGALSEWTGGQRTAEEVSQVLAKAMLGEREQLKELGIAIKEEDVTNRLREKGLEKLTGKMLEQAKATATLELITEKSTDAQRAFAEGNGTAIRNQAELNARIKETAQALGVALLPVFEKLLSVANFVVEVIEDITGGIDEFTGANRRAETAVFRLQTEFNNEIQTLQNANLKQEDRKKLIDSINEKYPGYLENLITETDSIDDLKTAQEQANVAFSDRIKLLATQRAFAEIQEQLVQAEVESLDLQIQRTEAQNLLNDATQRGKEIVGKDDRAQRNAINAIANLKNTEEAIKSNEREQEQLRIKLEQVKKAAEEANIALSGGGDDGDGDDGDDEPRKKTLNSINAITEAIKELETKLNDVEGADAYVRITQRIGELSEQLNAKQREFNEAGIQSAGGSITPDSLPVEEIEQAGAELLTILDELGINEEAMTLERQQRINAAIVEFSKRSAAEIVTQNLEKNQKIYEADLARAEKQQELESNLAVNQIETLQSIGVSTTEFLTGQQKSQKDFIKGLIKTLLTGLEKQVLLNIAGSVATEAGSKPFPFNLGPTAVKIAAIKAAFAVAKAGVQGFAEGGLISGQKVNASQNIPTQPNGDNVLATVKRGEVVLNQNQQNALGGPATFRRIGVPGFAEGGRIDTTPQPFRQGTTADNTEALEMSRMLIQQVGQLRSDFQTLERERKVVLVYQDVEDAGAKLADVRTDAAL